MSVTYEFFCENSAFHVKHSDTRYYFFDKSFPTSADLVQEIPCPIEGCGATAFYHPATRAMSPDKFWAGVTIEGEGHYTSRRKYLADMDSKGLQFREPGMDKDCRNRKKERFAKDSAMFKEAAGRVMQATHADETACRNYSAELKEKRAMKEKYAST